MEGGGVARELVTSRPTGDNRTRAPEPAAARLTLDPTLGLGQLYRLEEIIRQFGSKSVMNHR